MTTSARVVAMAGRGLSNEEIVEALFLAPLTVKTHVSRAMTKLHALTAPSSSRSPSALA